MGLAVPPSACLMVWAVMFTVSALMLPAFNTPFLPVVILRVPLPIFILALLLILLSASVVSSVRLGKEISLLILMALLALRVRVALL